MKEEANNLTDLCKKITHSTEPLGGVKTISLPEVEEVINGYSVEKMAEEYAKQAKGIDIPYENGLFYGYMEGFSTHQELVKDKLFTVEDMENLVKHVTNNYKINSWINELYSTGEHKNYKEIVNSYLQQSLLLKTEWNVEFDKQDKLKQTI